MVDVIDGSETVSTHGIINWILLLVIFSVGWRGMIVTICIITGTYLGSALIAHIVLVLSGTPWC